MANLRNKLKLSNFRFFCLILCLFALLCLVACKRGQEVGLNPNDFAPTFELLNLKGETQNFPAQKDKLLLINFFASWCEPCIEEMPSLQLLHEELSAQGFSVIAIAVDDQPEQIKPFVEKLNLTFPILLDSRSVVKNRYKVVGYPESFIVKNGQLKMLLDPEKNMPVVRIVGPRNWHSDLIKKQLKDLLIQD